MKKFILILTVFTIYSFTATAQSFSNHILSWWKFDEEIGGNSFSTVDEISNFTGTINGDLYEWISGVNGSALDFTHAEEFSILLVEDFDVIDIPDESFTAAIWVRMSMDLLDGEEQVIFCKGSIGTGEEHGPNSNGDRYMMAIKRFNGAFEIRFTVDDDDTGKSQLGFTPADTILSNDWVHLAGVRSVEEKMLYLYINGELVAEMEDVAVEVNTEGQAFQIGNYFNLGSMFKGAMDDLVIVEKALYETDINELISFNTQTSVSNKFKNNKLIIAPNIINKELALKNIEDINRLEIYNPSGKLIIVINNQYNNTGKFDVSNLTSGLYFVKAYTRNNIKSGKFIKK
ncbi:MAG: T9SS type A sorting domain-containing protein [Prolixibacteraceae bacterium]|nr:T9SS type A sorting domain-containing protein [Prolixibacteraceae bacterium]